MVSLDYNCPDPLSFNPSNKTVVTNTIAPVFAQFRTLERLPDRAGIVKRLDPDL